jgi:hypothetical protein
VSRFMLPILPLVIDVSIKCYHLYRSPAPYVQFHPHLPPTLWRIGATITVRHSASVSKHVAPCLCAAWVRSPVWLLVLAGPPHGRRSAPSALAPQARMPFHGMASPDINITVKCQIGLFLNLACFSMFQKNDNSHKT